MGKNRKVNKNIYEFTLNSVYLSIILKYNDLYNFKTRINRVLSN